MILFVIVVIDKNGVIGKDDDIFWYLLVDLKYFKCCMFNYYIIMGCKIFEFIGCFLLKCINIIVICNFFFMVFNCFVVGSFQEVIDLVCNNGEDEVFIIGGGIIYE